MLIVIDDLFCKMRLEGKSFKIRLPIKQKKESILTK